MITPMTHAPMMSGAEETGAPGTHQDGLRCRLPRQTVHDTDGTNVCVLEIGHADPRRAAVEISGRHPVRGGLVALEGRVEINQIDTFVLDISPENVQVVAVVQRVGIHGRGLRRDASGSERHCCCADMHRLASAHDLGWCW